MVWLWLACTGEKESITQEEIPFELSEWDRGLPPLTDNNLRGIVHLHSPYSHDACDGDPQPDGIPDEACLVDLREALCTVKIDVAFLSDHPTHSTEVTNFQDLFLRREGDQLFYDEQGMAIANRMSCENGHRTWIFAGVESSDMMPLGLQSHITDVYQGGYDGSPTAVDLIKEQGAASWVAHTETRTVEDLETLALDGLELYQLHANLDPDLRSDYLGLEPLSFLQEVQPFFFPILENGTPPEPDLGFIAFVEPNQPSIEKMETLGLSAPIGISAGTDAHQNVFPNLASDGERIDSYRRMMRWFNTRIQVLGESENPLDIREALQQRQTWIAFEIFGTPKDFMMTLIEDEESYPIGTERNLRNGQYLHLTIPTLHPLSPQGEEMPNIEARLFQVTEQGREQVHTWSEGTVDWMIEEAGVYRLEIWIQPLHLKPYLANYSDYGERWVPWIYSGAFFIRDDG